MMRSIKYFLLVIVVAGLTSCMSQTFAQSRSDFQRKYKSAMHYYNAGNYEKAFHSFKELTVENDRNEFYEYAHYFCGLSALKAQKPLDANFVLKKSLQKFPDSDTKDETMYLLANVAFERLDYVYAYQLLDSISDKKVKKDIPGMKSHYLAKAQSVELLYDLLCEYETDQEIVKHLAHRLNKPFNSYYEKEMLEYLIQEYDLNREKYAIGTFKKSEKKDVYHVAIMLPFKSHIPTGMIRNAKYYEMYEGIKLAVDALKKDGIKIELHAYDTRKDSATTSKILALPEMGKMDLLFGPIYKPMAEVAAQYACNHQINYVNPLFENDDFIRGKEHAFIINPSYVQIGKELARFSGENFVDRDVIIFYGTSEKDSIVAHEYHHVLDSNFTSHINFFQIDREKVGSIKLILNTLDSDNLSHIMVASSDDLMAANLISALEQANMHVPVIAPSKWLDVHLITYEQFQRRHFFFYYQDYIDFDDMQRVNSFREKFKERMNVKPMNRHAFVGYDAMLYWGNVLNMHGNLFNERLKFEPYCQGATMFGFRFSEGNTNNIVPVLRFRDDFRFDWVNPPR